MSWRVIFRSLRLMELSGEVVSGAFFHEVPGPQFASAEAIRELRAGFSTNTIYWLNATDPASVCGLPFAELKRGLPARIPTNHLVYRGAELAVVSQKNGRTLTFHLPPSDSNLGACLAFLRHLLQRDFQPLPRITIETINGQPALDSPYIDVIREHFNSIREPNGLTLYREPNGSRGGPAKS